MNRVLILYRHSICLLAAVALSMGAQQPTGPGTGARERPFTMRGTVDPLNSALHERVAAAGGHLAEVSDADPEDLAEDLPSLMTRSDEVLLVHTVTCFGGVSSAGDSVHSYYDVQVLRSWKGPHKTGDMVRVSVPAGGFLFRDGLRAEKRVNGFSVLRDGGRYVLFLHSSQEGVQGVPGFSLVGGGVQGAFMLRDEKVMPVYQQGVLAKAYSRRDVSAFLAEVDALNSK